MNGTDYAGDTSMNKFDSTLTFSKVLEPVRVSIPSFEDYNNTEKPIKKNQRQHRKNAKSSVPKIMLNKNLESKNGQQKTDRSQNYEDEVLRCSQMSVQKMLKDVSPVKQIKKFLSPRKVQTEMKI